MNIYSIESIFDDNFEQTCDCVCSTVDLNVAIKYIKNTPLPSSLHYYCVTVFDGFTGKPTHLCSVDYNERKHFTAFEFEEIK